MQPRRLFFVFGVIAVLLVASYQITSRLIGDGMRQLYVQRLEQCESVFRQYAEVHYVSKSREIEAGRYGFYEPAKLTDSGGAEQNWDYPARRIEAGIGYHPNRTTVMKFVVQHNEIDFTDILDSDLYALQISVSFD